MKYKIKLVKKEEVAEGTMAFFYTKPEGFVFKSGQTMDLTLINPAETDAEGNTRTFSIIQTPLEETLGNATRMRDTAFKRVLKNMPEGTELEMEGPFGSFTLHNDSSKPAVILAGGIGITPFYSIAKFAAAQKLPHKIYLFYSNRRPEDSAFLSQLQELQTQNPNFKLVATMTDMEKSSQKWDGETGYITKEMIAKYVPDLPSAISYIAGPPSMVAAMRKILNDAQVNDDNIRTEEFTGY
ncbi:MAG TPA: FAD-dependent oxidoreductase [Patescibacteria group bacterium]|nr:FAD-dependent oxidoreductase [Patescibacteria group bacterium]